MFCSTPRWTSSGLHASLTQPLFAAVTLALFLFMALPSQALSGSALDEAVPAKITVTGNVPNGVATLPYTATITASGGTAPYVFKSTLPKGLTINSSTGVITGTVALAGQYSFTVFVTDAASNHGQGAFTVTFTQPPVTITVAPKILTLPSGGTQEFLATVMNTTNTAVTWKATAGTIDAGGNFTAPTVTVNTKVTITATSQADTTKSATATATVTVSTVKPPKVALEVLFSAHQCQSAFLRRRAEVPDDK
ncbi:MAG TPA: Ig domain-containing protein [Candidatus Sulfotelmatobacter sp.]